MRILFTLENYFPNVSGVSVVVRYLAEGLSKLGHQITIATSSFGNCPAQGSIGGIDVYRFNLKKNHLDKYSGDIENYTSFITNFECDIIVFECVMCATTDLILPHLGKIKAKKILHSHGISGLRLKPFEKKKDILHTVANTYHWFFYARYFKNEFPKYLKGLDTICCLSEVDGTIPYCQKYGKDVQILGNAVEDFFLKPTKPVEQSDINSLGKPYFLSVAYYNQVKNQINILKEYYKSGINDYAMIFIGPAENDYYYNLLKENNVLETKYGKRSVLFLTHVNRMFIPDIIGNAKLYIVGSTIEQFSISIIEAMAKGVPFISTNVGNARLLPGGVTLERISDMHIKMQELLNNIELYNELSVAGMQYAKEKCTCSKVVKLLDEILIQTCK